ncbi:rhodanese-like domain-containing protein [Pseudonocardia adelaidensis]|uniref:Rhodanese-like domain-containing protein n=1 Tax=Pseudonocardia adelaidensis TaxID=648754 RepID=A0ABP9NFN6_9PSEU
MTLSVSPDAVAFFSSRLAFQTDVADVHAAVASGDPDFVLVDSRSRPAWEQGRIPGAVHLPTAEIPERAARALGKGLPVVTYCWGPGCNGATRAALALARLGHVVREMLGGIEYWAREGFPVETDAGLTHPDPDPLTTPCGC